MRICIILKVRDMEVRTRLSGITCGKTVSAVCSIIYLCILRRQDRSSADLQGKTVYTTKGERATCLRLPMFYNLDMEGCKKDRRCDS